MEYSEPELVLPALEALMVKDGLSTTELVSVLRKKLRPSGKDLESLKNRTDDHFSQKVRNLKSHDSLFKRGLTTFKGGRYFITEKGKKFVLRNKPIFDALRRQGFAFTQRMTLASKGYQDVLIEEGATQQLSIKLYERSKKLSEFARSYYADADGKIRCRGCGFEGTASYGKPGLGLIDIHHLRPLYIREGRSEKSQLKEAVRGVVPLCPNCHRLVHRSSDKQMSLTALQKLTGYMGT